MRCIKAGGIPEAVATVVLVLLVLLPRCFCTNDDVILADSDDCDNSNERVLQGGRSTHSRGCSGNPHQGTDANPAANDSSGGAPRPTHEQFIERTRRRHIRVQILLQRLWLARSNTSAAEIHLLPTPLHNTDYEEFRARLDKTQPVNARGAEQESFARSRVYLPQCSGPRNFTGQWNDGTNFRLYFDVESAAESSGQRQTRETKVLSASIHLKRKITPTASTLRATPTSGHIERQTSGEGTRQRVSAQKRRPPSTAHDSSALDGDSEQLKVIVYMHSRQTKRLRQETRSVIRTVLFPRNSPGWLRISLTSTVDDWVKRPQRNFGIQVTVLNEGGTEELHPGDYFEGFNCTEDHSQPVPVEFSLWTLGETLGHVPINDTVVDLETNLTQPYLSIITTEIPRSKSRHQRDLGAVQSAPSELSID